MRFLQRGRVDMSSVLIRDMKMPKSCARCRAWSMCWEDVPFRKTRHPTCPLVELHEHGDLIDRDEIIAEYDRQHKGPAGGARKIMEEAQAIVSAEREV